MRGLSVLLNLTDFREKNTLKSWHQSNYNSFFLGINRTELYVRFKGNQLNPSPKGNSFDVNISWDEPIFNKRLTGYQFSYQVGNRKMVVNETVSI